MSQTCWEEEFCFQLWQSGSNRPSLLLRKLENVDKIKKQNIWKHWRDIKADRFERLRSQKERVHREVTLTPWPFPPGHLWMWSGWDGPAEMLNTWAEVTPPHRVGGQSWASGTCQEGKTLTDTPLPTRAICWTLEMHKTFEPQPRISLKPHLIEVLRLSSHCVWGDKAKLFLGKITFVQNL